MPPPWRHKFWKPILPLLTRRKMTRTHDVTPMSSRLWWLLLFFSNVSNASLNPKTLRWSFFSTFDWSHRLVIPTSRGKILTSERNSWTIPWKVREGPLPGNKSGDESHLMSHFSWERLWQQRSGWHTQLYAKACMCVHIWSELLDTLLFWALLIYLISLEA